MIAVFFESIQLNKIVVQNFNLLLYSKKVKQFYIMSISKKKKQKKYQNVKKFFLTPTISKKSPEKAHLVSKNPIWQPWLQA